MSTDEEMMARCQKGDREAFGELVDRYERLIFSVCYRLLNNVEDARNGVQETFLKAWKHRDRFDKNRRFKPWLCQIATNDCLNYLKKASTRREQTGMDCEAEEDHSPVDNLEQSELQGEIQQALESLPPDYRELIVMKYVTGLSYDEMAKQIETSVSSVESKLHRARKELRELLEPVREVYLT